jgi:esterase/lipase superfamily enzyme
MAARFMVTNRALVHGEPGPKRAPKRSYWVSNGGPADRIASWAPRAPKQFTADLIRAAGELPAIANAVHCHEEQPHLSIFVHGYNTSWKDAAWRYDKLCRDLYDGPNGLGLCVLFTWPSDGSLAAYLPDRKDADESAIDFADVLFELYQYQVAVQAASAKDATKACHVKTSVVAHSMGNYVLQKGMARAWTRANQPLLVSLFSQLLMVAADVDNDLFASGETVDGSDGDAVANLCYRITALYSGRDPALAASAGLKHFGQRRLGRAGLARDRPVPANAWDLDCTPFFGNTKTADVHSAYFDLPKTIEIMRRVLRGEDRAVIRASL